MFNKKMLLWAGLFVASFVVINAGMYFFLKSTQPKMGARGDTASTAHVAGGDSAATKNETAARPDSAVHDTIKTDQVAAADATSDTTIALAQVQPVAEEPAPEQPETAIVEDTLKQTKTDTNSESAPENAAAALQAAQSGDNKEMAKLAKLLESMKPDDAAAIASELKTDQIVALVMRMKDRSAGKMLAALPVDQAARVAERMSQTATRTR